MQAAFVDIGLAKDAFLYAGDYTAKRLEEEEVAPTVDEEEDAAYIDDGESEPGMPAHAPVPVPPIEEMLHPGQEVLVQVSKESLGTKGARVTSFVSIPGRSIVYIPQARHVGVSRRIHDDEERCVPVVLARKGRPLRPTDDQARHGDEASGGAAV
jgi:ribonuclease G